MKNIGMKIAMVAIFVNAPRFVITFLAADAMRLPGWLEGTMLALTGIATGIVLTGGGAYIAHELIVMRGRAWSRIFMGISWVALLIFSVIILAPMMAAMLANSELASVLATVELRLWWSVASIVAIEVLTAGAMVAHAATQDGASEIAINRKPSAWSVVSSALANRIALQLQADESQIAQAGAQELQQCASVQIATSGQEIALQEGAGDAKALYLRLRASGRKHGELVKEIGVNDSTAASWWRRAQAQGAGD